MLRRLLHRTVASLLLNGEREGPASLRAAAEAITGTPWAGYRAGRQRLATLTAVYLTWLLPPAKWAVEIVSGEAALSPTGIDLLWCGPGGELIADELTPLGARGRLIVGDLASTLTRHVTARREGFAGVRVLALAAPRSSLFCTGTSRQPLRDAGLWEEVS